MSASPPDEGSLVNIGRGPTQPLPTGSGVPCPAAGAPGPASCFTTSTEAGDAQLAQRTEGLLMIAVALANGGPVLIARSRSGAAYPPAQTHLIFDSFEVHAGAGGHARVERHPRRPLRVNAAMDVSHAADARRSHAADSGTPVHEGNHAWRNILSAARAVEQDSARK